MDAPQSFDSQEPPAWVDVPMEAEPYAAAPVSAAQVQASAEPAASDMLQTTPLGDAWYAVVKQLDEAQTIVALVRQLAMQAQLVAREGGVWTLRVQRSSLNQTTTRERLLKALSQVTDCTSLQVESGLATDTPALRDKAHAEARQKQAEAIVHSDPKVQHLVQSLGRASCPVAFGRYRFNSEEVGPSHGTIGLFDFYVTRSTKGNQPCSTKDNLPV